MPSASLAIHLLTISLLKMLFVLLRYKYQWNITKVRNCPDITVFWSFWILSCVFSFCLFCLFAFFVLLSFLPLFLSSFSCPPFVFFLSFFCFHFVFFIWDIWDIWDMWQIWQFLKQSCRLVTIVTSVSMVTILQTCDHWDTDYNSYNWEPEFMTIFVTWQSRVTVDSIRNSCDVFLPRQDKFVA